MTMAPTLERQVSIPKIVLGAIGYLLRRRWPRPIFLASCERASA